MPGSLHHPILCLDAAPFCGGAQESFWSLLRLLPDAGFPVHLMTADISPHGLFHRAVHEHIPTTCLTARHWPKTVNGFIHFLHDKRAASPLVLQRLKEDCPPLLHANAIRSLLLLPRVQLPVILHDRDAHMPPGLTRILPMRFPHLHVVAPSELVLHKWRRLLPDSHLAVIPNPIEIPQLPPCSTSAALSTFNIILVADFLPWKGHLLFLESLSRFRQFHIPFHAVIKGRIRSQEGTALLQAVTNRIADLQLADSVTIHSEDESALPYIQTADLLVSCSQDEPFGRTIIEALCLGKPVVVRKGTGLDDQLLHCRAATLTSPDRLADAMASWSAPLKRQAVMEEARQFGNLFSASRHLHQMIEFYRNIIYCNEVFLH